MAARRKKPAPKKAAKKKASRRATKRPTKPRLQAALEAPEEAAPGPGRPTIYRPEMSETARQLYSAGATDLEVADALGIASSTLYLWQQRHPEFSEAAGMGLEAASDRVERSLFNRAVGYTFESEKIFSTAAGVVRVPCREHVPPDPKAALTWLKNRRKERWKDSREIEGRVQLADLLIAAGAGEGAK